MEQNENRYPSYPIFKGLQKPIEFMGIQGRYIYWAAGTIGAAIISLIIGYCIFGFMVGLVGLVISLSIGIGLIMFKQRKGLHTKNIDKGDFVYAHSKRI